MPQVAVNGASFGQRITGVQRYARELTTRLLANEDTRLILPAPAADFVAPAGARVEVAPPSTTLSRLGAWGWLDTGLRRALGDDEVLWSPTIRAPVSVRRQVLTVHDLSTLDHPEWFSKPVVAQWRLLLPALLRRVAHVVTDSEFSRHRLLARGVEPDRVSVVPCGVDPRFARSDEVAVDRVRAEMGLPDRFVLALGSVDPRKNIGLLVEAWKLMRPDPDVGLVLAGGSSAVFADDPVFSDLPPGVRHLGYVPDSDLPALYQAADVFAFPSHYEGFGLPPLEAMAAGTPVIGLSTTDAVREVVGEAGMLVPGDARSWAAAIAEVLSDSGRASELAEKGQDRSRSYSWDAAAERLRAVIAQVPS